VAIVGILFVTIVGILLFVVIVLAYGRRELSIVT